MPLVDENLRHSAAAIGALRHSHLPGAVAIDADLLKRDILLVQQAFGRRTIAAGAFGINHDIRHGGWFLATIRRRYRLCTKFHKPCSTRANTSTSTRPAPARSSTRDAALAVAPEVMTSSTSTTARP